MQQAEANRTELTSAAYEVSFGIDQILSLHKLIVDESFNEVSALWTPLEGLTVLIQSVKAKAVALQEKIDASETATSRMAAGK